MYHARCTTVVVAIGLVVTPMTVTGIDIKEQGIEGVLVGYPHTGINTVCLGKLFHIRALERAVVIHNVTGVNAIRVAHRTGVAGADISAPVHSAVGSGEGRRNQQVGVAVTVVADTVVKCLDVKIQRTAQ